MKTLPIDTRPETEKVLISLLRNADAAKKFAQIRSFSQTVMQLSRRAIVRANQDLSEEQINLQFISLHYGRDLAKRVEQYLNRKCWMKIPDIFLAVKLFLIGWREVIMANHWYMVNKKK